MVDARIGLVGIKGSHGAGEQQRAGNGRKQSSVKASQTSFGCQSRGVSISGCGRVLRYLTCSPMLQTCCGHLLGNSPPFSALRRAPSTKSMTIDKSVYRIGLYQKRVMLRPKIQFRNLVETNRVSESSRMSTAPTSLTSRTRSWPCCARKELDSSRRTSRSAKRDDCEEATVSEQLGADEPRRNSPRILRFRPGGSSRTIE